MPKQQSEKHYYAFGSLIPERSGEANCVPCGVLAQAIKNTYASTLDDTWTNSAYMTNITAEFTNRGLSLPDDIDDVADVLALCSLTAQNPESTGEVDMVWDDDADRKRTICPDGSLSFTNDYDQYNYRFGFNGMECDDDVKGEGNSYTTELRILDTRLGRWLSLDPMSAKFPWQSPYATFDNCPTSIIDPSGGEGGPAKDKFDPAGQKVTTPDGETRFIPSNAIPLNNEQGQTVGFIGYNTVFRFIKDQKNVGFVDPDNKHVNYYEEDYYNKQNNDEFSYLLYNVATAAGGDILECFNDPIKYAGDTWDAVRNFDLAATWDAVCSMGSNEKKYFAATFIYGFLTSNPKRALWTVGKHGNVIKNAFEHFKKHGADFGALNAVDYVRKARKFMFDPPTGTLVKVTKNGDVQMYNQATNTFAVMDHTGTPKTFYKPGPKSLANPNGYNPANYTSPLDYFMKNQPHVGGITTAP